MASASDIRAGRAYIEIYVRNNRLLRDLANVRRRMENWGRSMQTIGNTMFVAAGAAALPFGLATKTFVGFEDQMKAVQAVTGATGEAFDVLYNKAKELGRTTSFTAGEVGGGMLSLARAGFSPSEIDAAIAGMLNLARATGTDLAMSSDIAAGTLRAFNLEAGQMSRVSDVLVATANNSAQTLEDLGESMRYVAPIAQEYGMSLEETSKAIGVLANMQIKGSMAGTSMRQAMIRLADPSVQKRLAAMGVAVTDTAGNLRTDFGTMFSEIGNAMKAMPTGKRIALLSDLFDQRAMGAAAKLAGTDFPALNKAIDNAAGTADRTAKTMDSGLGGAFRRLKSGIEGVAIAVGESVSGAFSVFADTVASLSLVVTKVIGDNQQFVIAAVSVIAVVGAAGASFIALGITLKLAAFGIGALATVVSLVTTGFSALIGIVVALVSPIGAVSVAVAGLAGYLLYTSDAGGQAIAWLATKFSELRAMVSVAFQGISDALASGDIALAGQILWASLRLEWQKGVNALSEIWIGFKQIFLEGWTDAVYGMAKIFTNAIAGLELAWINFAGVVTDTWMGTQQGIAEGLAWIIAKTEGLDPEEVVANVRGDYGRRKKETTESRDRRLRNIERGRAGSIQQLEDERRRKNSERQSSYGQQMTAAEKELAELEKRRNELIDEAARKKESSAEIAPGAPGAPDAPGAPGVLIQKVADTVTGTFSGYAAARMAGGGGPAEQTARNTASMAKDLRQLPKHLRELLLGLSETLGVPVI